ncbi:MAG: hypothetical protein PT939_04995 [Aerococcus suis]|nr:hypothetical protein [Aerococcus suis]
MFFKNLFMLEADDLGAQGSGEDNTVEGQEEVKTLTQDEANHLITQAKSKGKKEALNNALKDLGLDSLDDVKAIVEEHNAQEEANQTELDKANKQLETLQAELEKAQANNDTLQARNKALELGVKDDSVDDVITLARQQVNDEVTIDDAIKSVIDKYSMFSDSETKGKPSIVTGGNPQTQAKSGSDAFELAFGKY